jgi:hypothetical protein
MAIGSTSEPSRASTSGPSWWAIDAWVARRR